MNGVTAPSARNVRRLLAFHGWSISRLTPAPAGINTAFHATARRNNELFVKIRVQAAGGLSEAQYRWLVTTTGLPMPSMLGRYEFEDGQVCEVYERVYGRDAQLLWPTLSSAGRRLVARYLAVFAATLHGLADKSQGMPVLNLRSRIRLASEQLRDTIPTAHPLWSVMNRLPAASPRRKICHGDLNVKNLLVTSSGAVYLVDWEWAALAEPAYEFKNTRSTARRGYRELRYVQQDYEAITGRAIAEERLLIADLDYALILLSRAQQSHLENWQAVHLKRLSDIASRLHALL